MKKLGIILAIVVALTFVVGCASSGGADSSKSSGGAALKPYSVDLSTLAYTKNPKPFTRKYDDMIIPFPSLPVDVTQYSRVTITVKYFNAAGEEIEQSDTKAMVSFLYEAKGGRGPDMGPGGNAPLKELNVGGFSGLIDKDRGVRIKLTKVPEVIILQNSDLDVKFIELTGIIFHNKTASGK